MPTANTPMPGDTDKEKQDPAAEEGVEGNAQPEPESSVPPVEDEPDVEDTDQQPT